MQILVSLFVVDDDGNEVANASMSGEIADPISLRDDCTPQPDGKLQVNDGLLDTAIELVTDCVLHAQEHLAA